MELFVLIPSIVGIIIFIAVISIIVRVIRFTFKLGKNVSQTILEKTDPHYIKNKDKVEKQEERPLYEDEQISVRLQQDLVKREGEIVYCEYCGCKNKRRDCRCHGCKAPLK